MCNLPAGTKGALSVTLEAEEQEEMLLAEWLLRTGEGGALCAAELGDSDILVGKK